MHCFPATGNRQPRPPVLKKEGQYLFLPRGRDPNHIMFTRWDKIHDLTRSLAAIFSWPLPRIHSWSATLARHPGFNVP